MSDPLPLPASLPMPDPLPLPGPWVDLEWLEQHIDDPRLVLIDATPAEVDGESSGALPGAVHVEHRELSDPSSPFDYTYGGPDLVAAVFARAGVGDDSTVVLYDHGRGSWAALGHLVLRSIGFDRAAVLDGGPRAWVAGGRSYADALDAYPAEPARLTVHHRPEVFVSRDDVATLVGSGERQLLATLAWDVFAGEVSSVSRPGHIPNSVNLPQADLVDDGGLFLPPDELRRRFAATGIDVDSPVATYCVAGITAALHALVLRSLGSDVVVYNGGLQEWSATPELEVVQGGRPSPVAS